MNITQNSNAPFHTPLATAVCNYAIANRCSALRVASSICVAVSISCTQLLVACGGNAGADVLQKSESNPKAPLAFEVPPSPGK